MPWEAPSWAEKEKEAKEATRGSSRSEALRGDARSSRRSNPLMGGRAQLGLSEGARAPAQRLAGRSGEWAHSSSSTVVYRKNSTHHSVPLHSFISPARERDRWEKLPAPGLAFRFGLGCSAAGEPQGRSPGFRTVQDQGHRGKEQEAAASIRSGFAVL